MPLSLSDVIDDLPPPSEEQDDDDEDSMADEDGELQRNSTEHAVHDDNAPIATSHTTVDDNSLPSSFSPRERKAASTIFENVVNDDAEKEPEERGDGRADDLTHQRHHELPLMVLSPQAAKFPPTTSAKEDVDDAYLPRQQQGEDEHQKGSDAFLPSRVECNSTVTVARQQQPSTIVVDDEVTARLPPLEADDDKPSSALKRALPVHTTLSSSSEEESSSSSSDDDDDEKKPSTTKKDKMKATSNTKEIVHRGHDESRTMSKTASSSSGEESSSSSSDEDEKKPSTTRKKDKMTMSSKQTKTEPQEFADLPDPQYLDQLSDDKLSRKDISALRWWSFFVVLDKHDPSTWRLPYRDGLGRLNRPLLAHARQVLTDEFKVNEMGLLLSRQVLDQARKCFYTAWPGQPCRLVHAVDAPVSSSSNQLQSTQSIIEESMEMKKKLDKVQPTAQTGSSRAVVVVESDVAPNILMKLRERRAAQQQQQQLQQKAPVRNAPSSARAKHQHEMMMQAKRKLAEDRQLKSRIDSELQKEVRPPTAIVVQEETEQQQGEDSEEADEDWEPEKDEDEDEDQEDEDEDDEDDDEHVPATADQEEEEEIDGPTPPLPVSTQESVEPTEVVIDVNVVESTSTKENVDVTASPTQVVVESSSTKEKKNSSYRALLEADAAATAKRSRFLENEAEEEEEEDQVGNYGVKEKVMGMDSSDEEEEERMEDLLPTEDDLKHIVDTNSDDEGNDQNAIDLFQKQQDERDEQMLKRVKKDVENHTFVDRRRKLIASGVQRALEDGDSDDSEDEELDQARQKRLEDEKRQRMVVASSSRNAKGTAFLGEKVEEIEMEQEQSRRFLEMAQKLKRTNTITSSTATTKQTTTMYSENEGADEDSKTVLESLMSRSQPAFTGGGGEILLARSKSFLERETSLPPMMMMKRTFLGARSTTTAISSSSSSTVSTMTKSFVYTKRAESGLMVMQKDEEEILEDKATVNVKQENNNHIKRAKTMPVGTNKRRVPLMPVHVNKALLPSATLLAPARLDKGNCIESK